MNDELYGISAEFPRIWRGTQLRKFLTTGCEVTGEGPRRHAGQSGQFGFIHCLHMRIQLGDGPVMVVLATGPS